MKFHLRSISVILFCIGIVLPINTRASQTASAPISPLTIAVSTTSNQYKIDSPILVVVTLTNTSSEPVRLINFRIADAAYRRLSWEYSLTREGANVEKTAFHRAIRGESCHGEPYILSDGSFVPFTMTPGQVDHTTIDVKKLFNISQPGSY
jgi:hypothetical protein